MSEQGLSLVRRSVDLQKRSPVAARWAAARDRWCAAIKARERALAAIYKADDEMKALFAKLTPEEQAILDYQKPEGAGG